jgi:hypothetical protein
MEEGEVGVDVDDVAAVAVAVAVAVLAFNGDCEVMFSVFGRLEFR